MRHARVVAFATLAACVAAAVALAQSAITPIPDSLPVRVAPLEIDLSRTTWGDPKAGQAKAAACAACHGPDGNSPIDMYPRIAGQSERYIAHQLALIANGQRTGGAVAVMLPFVQELSAQDMRDIGAFFATQKAGAGLADDSLIAEGPYKDMKFYEIGQKLYRGGDPARGIPACLACHGPAGTGNPGPAYPHIGGQHAAYLARRLQEYQSGQTTETDRHLFDIMAQVTHALTEQEIQALSSYLQGLHDRADDEAAAQLPATAPGRS
ncbi:MAG: c-type cytochrome [Pseudomonas sp.]